MRVKVGGSVAEVAHREYKQGNEVKKTFDAWIQSGRFIDRISGPADLAPAEGDEVEYVAMVTAKVSKGGAPYLNVWCVERVDVETTTARAPLSAVAGQ